MPEAGSEPVSRFIETFNARDLDGFVATLHPEIEIHGNRGVRSGIGEAREWATRKPGGIQQTIVLDEMRGSGDKVVALIRREWRWDEEGHEGEEMAGQDEMAWLFELRDGRILSWRPFEDRSDALGAAGLD